MIEDAENVLRDLGFYDVRVRHHELRGERGEGRGAKESPLSALTSPLSLHLARIELGAAEIPRLLDGGAWEKVAAALKQIGYAHVTLDLAGYRRGSMNETAVRFGAPVSAQAR
jgi:uncharacterized protein